MQLEERRYRISEVHDLVDVPIQVLRQWERRYSQLNPKRNRGNQRRYEPADIRIVQRIKELLWDEKMTSAGVQRVLDQEAQGKRRPKTARDAVDLADQIEREVRGLIDFLDSDDT